MTPEAYAAELLARGYQEISEFQHHDTTYRVGSRICGRGELWPEAVDRGTGTIERIFENPNSGWSRQWGIPDVEFIVANDPGTSRAELSAHRYVAVHHIYLAEEARS